MHDEMMHQLLERGQYRQAVRLFQEMDRLRTAWDRMPHQLPLRRGEISLLGTLVHLEEKGGPITISGLAAYTGRSMAGVSQRVTALEEQGLVRRVPVKDDRRVVAVQITPEGRKTAQDSMDGLLAFVEGALEHMGRPGADELLRLMGQLSAAMQQVYSENEKPSERQVPRP